MNQIQKYEGLITRYYIFVFIVVAIGAYFVYREKIGKLSRVSMPALFLVPFGLILSIYLIGTTNLKIIQADIDYKLADPFTKGNSWPVAIKIYDRALSLAPNEDFYYLFLGRAYLEYGKTITDTTEQEKLITQAQRDLEKAQHINPLNTDHTANLARLYSMWSSMTEDSQKKLERAQKSDYYFSRAIVLSQTTHGYGRMGAIGVKIA
jgi:tetratricopeptide (TPR) repeat protein